MDGHYLLFSVVAACEEYDLHHKSLDIKHTFIGGINNHHSMLEDEKPCLKLKLHQLEAIRSNATKIIRKGIRTQVIGSSYLNKYRLEALNDNFTARFPYNSIEPMSIPHILPTLLDRNTVSSDGVRAVSRMDYALEKYRHMWAPLIEPDDCHYSQDCELVGFGWGFCPHSQAEIGPKETVTVHGVTVRRRDFVVKNARGLEKDESAARSACLVYSHSHSGNKAEGALLLPHFQDHFNFVVFDYTGYGYSEKDHCTLGVKESEDLDAVIMYVRQIFNFKRIYVWGRSQGDKLKEVTGFDVMGIDLKEKVPAISIPGFFIIPTQDKISGTANIENLFRTYGAERKGFVHMEGEHSGLRPEETIQPALQFLLNLEKDLAADEARREVLSELRGFRGPKIEKMRRDTLDRLLSLKDSPRSSFIETSLVVKSVEKSNVKEDVKIECSEDIPQERRQDP